MADVYAADVLAAAMGADHREALVEKHGAEAVEQGCLKVAGDYLAALLALVPEAEGVFIDRDGRVWGLEEVGRVDKPSMTDTYWHVEGGEITHPTAYVHDVEGELSLPDDPGWYDPAYRLVPVTSEED